MKDFLNILYLSLEGDDESLDKMGDGIYWKELTTQEIETLNQIIDEKIKLSNPNTFCLRAYQYIYMGWGKKLILKRQ